jgi:uncharacterized membrane protein YkvA (DUF1232 family)
MVTKLEGERLVDELTSKADPARRAKIDAQFEGKLARIRTDGLLAADVIARLEVMWTMFHAPDEEVPWKQKALIMGALGYLVAPIDLIPDLAGKAGYFDDKMVINIVYRRLGAAVTAFGGAVIGD